MRRFPYHLQLVPAVNTGSVVRIEWLWPTRGKPTWRKIEEHQLQLVEAKQQRGKAAGDVARNRLKRLAWSPDLFFSLSLVSVTALSHCRQTDTNWLMANTA